jgi:hypothetical protein
MFTYAIDCTYDMMTNMMMIGYMHVDRIQAVCVCMMIHRVNRC